MHGKGIYTYNLPVSSPDYLNNLSPDSKEYEDTQGNPRKIQQEMNNHSHGGDVCSAVTAILTLTAAAPHVSDPIC